ncbi:MAG: T9SS type A sorting domain-containing protein [Bacteroidia bacterium]|nr:T9SS type A sorting domain-containing protein [Bacteroidia bacterium]
MQKYFILCLYILTGIPAFAQYTGGSFSGSAINNIACPVPVNIFLGGASDGFVLNSTSCVAVNIFPGGSYDGFALNNIACPPVAGIFLGGASDGFAIDRIACPATIFTGGSYDGFALNSLISCPEAIYKGGSYDGFAVSNIACPSGADIFFGGSYDGFVLNSTSCVAVNIFLGGSYCGFAINSIACPVPVNIFLGGFYDGFVLNSNACPSVASIFLGGSYDGFALNSASCVAVNIFFGGSYDGFVINSIACPPVASIFLGGAFDGFAINSIACPSTIFTGGSFDGFALANIACPTPFKGGSYDGFALNNISCPAVPAIFLGGSYDGFALNNISCVILNISKGGTYGGFACRYGGVCSPLPIELLYFTANLIDIDALPKVLCKWATAGEINNDYFTLEKTKDAFQFFQAGIIQGAGNSNQNINYQATDNDPFSGTSYYRLKQTDYNGEFKYSDLVAVDFIQNLMNFFIYPNPFNNKTNMIIDSSVDLSSCKIVITDMLGEIVKQYKNITSPFIIDRTGLAGGIYYLILSSGNTVQSKKLVIY